jgi:hypothetical protein
MGLLRPPIWPQSRGELHRERRSAGSFSAVVWNLEKIRGELIAIRQNTAFDSAFYVSGEQK